MNITVIIPTYNYGGRVINAIDSVLPQLTGADELVVVDDGSTDDTTERLAARFPARPSNLRMIRQENSGAAAARNRGFRESQGDFLLFLDADDELLPGALSALQRHISNHPDTRVVLGGYRSIWPDGKTRESLPNALPEDPQERITAYLFDKSISLSHGASAMHRSVLIRAPYPEQFRSQEDIPVFAQAIANYPCSVLEFPLVAIHKHAGSLRHQAIPALAGGLALVDEVFSPVRLGPEFQHLKDRFYVKRCLTLSRIAFNAGERATARHYLMAALRKDWKQLIIRPSLFFRMLSLSL